MSVALRAQEAATDRVEPATITIGPGLGLDYGGLGAQLSGRPVPMLNLLLGVGYNLNGAGINAGAAWRMLPKKRFCPYVVGLYGYNAVINIRNDEEYTRTYYGPSAGLGLEIHPRRMILGPALEHPSPFGPGTSHRKSHFNPPDHVQIPPPRANALDLSAAGVCDNGRPRAEPGMDRR
ncbi:MAG: hypothetical protein IPM68_09480 [Flavobacteriales bacterium]|nr:hypothetical protein [Flavobacteriales bacterium]